MLRCKYYNREWWGNANPWISRKYLLVLLSVVLEREYAKLDLYQWWEQCHKRYTGDVKDADANHKSAVKRRECNLWKRWQLHFNCLILCMVLHIIQNQIIWYLALWRQYTLSPFLCPAKLNKDCQSIQVTFRPDMSTRTRLRTKPGMIYSVYTWTTDCLRTVYTSPSHIYTYMLTICSS